MADLSSIPHGDPLTNAGNVGAGIVVGHSIWEGISQNPLNSTLTILSIIWFGLQISRFVYEWVKKK